MGVQDRKPNPIAIVVPSASGRRGIVPGSPVGFGAAPRAERPAERARQTLGWGVVFSWVNLWSNPWLINGVNA